MEIHIGKRIAEVELLGKEGNQVSLSVDGTVYEVDITMVEDGLYSILKDGKSYNAELTRSGNNKSYQVNTGFSTHSIEIIDTQAKYLRLKKKSEGRQDNKVVSPMPGKIIHIPFKSGDKVNAGETVIVIEAMKMQSNYKVSTDCIIKEILVKENDTVTSNQPLILLEL